MRGAAELVEGRARRCSCRAGGGARGAGGGDGDEDDDAGPGAAAEARDHWHARGGEDTGAGPDADAGADARSFRLGREMFAARPQEAVHLWAEAGVFGAESPCDAAVARFLYKHEELDRRAVWEFLASSKPVLEAFVRLFDVRDRPLDEALREVFGALGVVVTHRDDFEAAAGPWSPASSRSSRSWRRSLSTRSSSASSSSRSRVGARGRRSSSRRFSTSSSSASSSTSFSKRLRRRASFSGRARGPGTFDAHSARADGPADSPASHFDSEDFAGSGSDAWRASDSAALEHKRFACRTFADWFWALNEDIIGAWIPSANVVFALVLQLVSLSENRAAQLRPRSRHAMRTGAGTGANAIAARDAAGAEFVETCQNVMMSLDAPSLRESMLLAMFRRVYQEPFAAPPRASYMADALTPSAMPGPAGAGTGDGGDGCCQGYLWLPTLDALPCPWERRWVVLADWVLYVYRASRDPRELLMIAPLSNVEPDLQPCGIRLEGRIKLALAKGALDAAEAARPASSKQNQSRRKPKRSWFARMFLSTPVPSPSSSSLGKSSPTRARGGGAAPLVIDALELAAQTPSDALRWVEAFRGGLHSPAGAKSAEFAANVERYCNEEEAASARASSAAAASSHAKLLHDLEWANRRGDLTQGVLWIRKPAFRDEETAKGKHKKMLDDLYSFKFTERYCSLLSNQLVVSNDATSLDHHGVIDLSKLRMLVPTNHKWAKDQGLFPFELVNSELQVLCACAAPTLKDYVLWNKALTPLLPSKGRYVKQQNMTKDAARGGSLDNDANSDPDDNDKKGVDAKTPTEDSSSESGISSDDGGAHVEEEEGEEEEEEEEEEKEESREFKEAEPAVSPPAQSAREEPEAEASDSENGPGLASIPQTLEEITSAYASLIGKATALLNRDLDSVETPRRDDGDEALTSLRTPVATPGSASASARTPAPPVAPVPTPPPPDYAFDGASFDSLPKPDKKRRRENTPRASSASASASASTSSRFLRHTYGLVEEIPPTPEDQYTPPPESGYGFRAPAPRQAGPPPSMPPPTPPQGRRA